MSKKIVKVVKMELPGGEAHPGPKLASAGVVMNKFCTDFNPEDLEAAKKIVAGTCKQMGIAIDK